MNRKSSVSMGPGAASLTLVFVMLSISVLGMLSLMSGLGERRFSDRSTEVNEEIYALKAEAETSYALLDSILYACRQTAASEDDYLHAVEERLPDGFILDGREIYWTAENETRTLELAVEILPLTAGTRLRWSLHYLETTAMEDDSWS